MRAFPRSLGFHSASPLTRGRERAEDGLAPFRALGAPMILGLSLQDFTTLHVAISLIAIVPG